MKRHSNTAATKMDDSEEDTDSELEEEQNIRNKSLTFITKIFSSSFLVNNKCNSTKGRR